MSLLSRIATALKAVAKWLGIKARTWQSPSRSSTVNNHSNSGKPPPPNRGETTPGETEPDLSRLPGTDNKCESLDGHAGLSENQHPSEPFDGDPLSTVTKTDPELDTSEPAGPGLNAVSSDSDDIHQSLPSSPVVESSSSDTSIQLLGVQDKDHPSTHDIIPGSDDPDANADLSQIPKVPRKPQSKPRQISGRRSRMPRRSSNAPPALRGPRPELLCYKDRTDGTWKVVLSGDEEFQIKAVYLQGKKLDVANNKCRIPSLTGQLTIEYQDEPKQDETLFEDKPLIFKLQKNWAGNGRKITAITSGYFIVFAPAKWNRTGYVPVAPEGCRDAAFLAHYFYREAQSLDEHIDGFRECENFRAITGIKLSGQRVFDDSDEGDLFVQRVPELTATQDVVWARVGREAKSGWKGQNFKPAEQSLSDILSGREGRFFLRVYDSSCKLLDSTTFRFLQGLKQIWVDGKPYTKDTILLPNLNGHPYTEVHSVGADDSNSLQITLCGGTRATVKSGILTVDRSPEANRILCKLGSGNNAAKIKLDLPRTWWNMVSHGKIQCAWRDKPLNMTRQEFQEHADNCSEIRLLQKGLPSIQVGFDDEQKTNFKLSNGECIIPLREFVDHVQIDQRLSADAYFKVKLAGKTLQLIVISADPVPEIESFTASPMRIFKGEEAILRWVTSEANQAQVTITPGIGLVESEGHCIERPIKTTTYTLSLVAHDTYRVEKAVTVNVDLPYRSVEQLRPRVRRHDGSGWKNAKGFSHNEVQCAGLTLRDAYRYSFRLDTRRQTVHQINVQALKTLLNEYELSH